MLEDTDVVMETLDSSAQSQKSVDNTDDEVLNKVVEVFIAVGAVAMSCLKYLMTKCKFIN